METRPNKGKGVKPFPVVDLALVMRRFWALEDAGYRHFGRIVPGDLTVEGGEPLTISTSKSIQGRDLLVWRRGGGGNQCYS